jgi:hypothetical protein
MSLFNWFSGKSGHDKTDGEDSAGSVREAHSRPLGARDKISHALNQRPPGDPTQRGEERKVKRHARREQLYVAVREAMTRSGVLSASYKFKVLSLDQIGDQFLVMMDLDQAFGADVDKLHEVEHEIVQTAKARFDILVTSVYWRVEGASGAPARPEHDPGRTAALHAGAAAAAAAARKKPLAPRYEPIQADEVAAFKQALAAASAASPVAAQNAKVRSAPRSYTLLTGFEDTEMPDSPAVPALSATQYGDLN